MSTEHLTKKFGTAGEKGGNAEDWLYRKLQTIYDDIVDYRSDMIKQGEGIDFSVKKKNWFRPFTLDCKSNLYIDQDQDTETYKTYFEYIKNGKPGWFLKSKADRIYHINTFKGKGIFYDLNEMRQVVSRRLLFQDMKGFEVVKTENDLLLKVDLSLPEIKILCSFIY
jgi:hypothetical protein